MKKDTYLFAMVLFVVLVISRLVPHPQNFTALAGVALFSGSLFEGKPWRFLVPIGALLFTDLYFGIYPGIIFTYISVIAIVAMAPEMKSSIFKVAGCGVGSAVLFYLVTNFGVWLQTGMYEMTASGLMKCYAMGLPFFQNTLVSTLFYSIFLYSSYHLVAMDQGLKGFVTPANGR